MDRKWVDDGDLMLMSSCHVYLLFVAVAVVVDSNPIDTATALVYAKQIVIWRGGVWFLDCGFFKRSERGSEGSVAKARTTAGLADFSF